MPFDRAYDEAIARRIAACQQGIIAELREEYGDEVVAQAVKNWNSVRTRFVENPFGARKYVEQLGETDEAWRVALLMEDMLLLRAQALVASLN